MIMMQFEYKDKIYSIQLCTQDDIPSHIERVSSYWKQYGVDIPMQADLLAQSVDEGTAYKLVDEDNNLCACIYCLMIGTQKAMSVMLWFKDKRMFAMLCYFFRMGLSLYSIAFKPHTKDFIPFAFAIDEYSIRAFYDLDRPLIIDLYSQKSTDIYNWYFVDAGIKVL